MELENDYRRVVIADSQICWIDHEASYLSIKHLCVRRWNEFSAGHCGQKFVNSLSPGGPNGTIKDVSGKKLFV